MQDDAVEIGINGVSLEGNFAKPPDMKAIIVFSHGSGSSRKSPRNIQVARALNAVGFGTLLFDLLMDEEAKDRRNVFDINFLGGRLVSVTRWLLQQPEAKGLRIGYFGASTGAAAALKASAMLKPQENVYSIVSRGGRPDLAGDVLAVVKVPTLLLVGSLDAGVIELNQEAGRILMNSKISIIKGATHLFEEPGTLEEVSRQAAEWFDLCLRG